MAMNLPDSPTFNPRGRLPRALLLLVLLVATTVLLRGPHPSAAPVSRRDPAAVQAVFIGDLMYRLGEFVQLQSQRQPGVSWYPGYLLSQMGLARYERHAAGPRPDRGALLRVGIVYCRNGYLEPGQQALLAAAHQDPAEYLNYVALASLYAPKPQATDLERVRKLLGGEPPWLGQMVRLDRARHVPGLGKEAAAEWQRSLNQFAVAVVGAMVLLALLVSGGVAVILLWLLRRLFVLEPKRYQAPLRVPWNLPDVVETVVVLSFLFALISALAAALQSLLPPGPGGSVWRAGVLALDYLGYLGLALAFCYSRAGQGGRRAWRLLGFRALPAAKAAAVGLRAYAVFWALAIYPLKLYLDHFLSAAQPALSGREPVAAYLIYAVLLCGAVPVVEEVLFRGFLHAGLRQVLPVGSAAVLSGLAFAALHFPGGITELLFLGGLGVVLALVYENTRSLWPGIILHAVHNALVLGVIVAALAL